MPNVIEKLTRMPNLFLAGVNQPESHLVRPADMTQVVDMLISAADADQIFPQCNHARTVIASVKNIQGIPEPGWLAGFPVYASLADNFFNCWVIERIKSSVIVTHLV